jgi:hypothetical protein
MEAWYAHSLGKLVVAYTGCTPAHPWTAYVADVICDELERAVQELRAGTGCGRAGCATAKD